MIRNITNNQMELSSKEPPAQIKKKEKIIKDKNFLFTPIVVIVFVCDNKK